jgi:hypothetical protein
MPHLFHLLCKLTDDGKAVLGVRWLATAFDFALTEAVLPEKSGTKVPHSKDRSAINSG